MVQSACLFLALDGGSTFIYCCTSRRKDRMYEENPVFIRNESLHVVWAQATSAFKLEHMPWLLCSVCPMGYEIQIAKYLSHRSMGNIYGSILEVRIYL